MVSTIWAAMECASSNPTIERLLQTEVEADTHYVHLVLSSSPAISDSDDAPRALSHPSLACITLSHCSITLKITMLHYFQHFNILQRKSKLRMSIPHIIQIPLPISIISPPTISNPILPPQPKIKYRTRDTAQPDHAKGDAVAQGIRGCL